MKRFNIFAGGLLLLALQSCNFLDRDPMDTIGKEAFFSTANATALEQYCNDLYPKLITGHGDLSGYSFGMMDNDFQSDNLIQWDINNIGFGLHLIPDTKKDTQWSWENIRACNDFLQSYQLSPEPETVKNKYAGEILFFKSMDYFNKVKAYGDVPWYEKAMIPGDPDLYKGRDSRVLVMANVLRDINQAIAWLPKKSGVVRVSKDAALALKARICLFEGTYRRYHGIEGDVEFLQAAYDAAGELMKPEYGYKLFSGSSPAKSYHELFIQADYNANTEVILSKEYDPSKGKGNNVTRMIYVGETPIGMTKDCADDYLCATTGMPISICGCTGHTQHTTLIAELKNRDPRMLQTIPTPEAGKFTYYLNGKSPKVLKDLAGDNIANPTVTPTGYNIVKYYNEAEFSPEHGKGTLDAPVFRYAEVLLVRAEAGAELGKDPELELTVNALRDRVGFTHHLTANPVQDPKLVEEYPIIIGTNANLIREIRRERRVELFAEGYRYADLMRWACGARLAKLRTGIIPDATLYTEAQMMKIIETVGVVADGALDVYSKRVDTKARFEDPKHYLMPIPSTELSLNPNLAPNNPGW